MVNTQRTITPYGAQNDCPLCKYSAVPQTRKRLILVARRDGIKPRKPLATHAENPAPMFDDRKKWVGWYEAIEDLIPTLPPSQFAKWQLERLPKELQTCLVTNQGDAPIENADRGPRRFETSDPAGVVIADSASRTRAFLAMLDNPRANGITALDACTPSATVQATAMRRDVNIARAFLMQVQGEGGDGIKEQTEPMQTVTENHSAAKYRAFITAGGDAWSPVLDDTAPLFTLSSSKAEHATRAFLVNESSTMEVREKEQPATTQIANGRNGGIGQRCFIWADRNTKTSEPIMDDRPAFTLMAGHANHNRAYLNHGRVVKMTPRALARFQSFPDAYALPDNARLACTIIGNAVPPLLMQRVIEAQLL